MTTSTQKRSLIAEILDAFPAVCGPRFWPRVRRLAAILAVLAVARSIIADCSTVPSGSMIPTLLVGDRVVVNKLAYDLKVPFTTLHLMRWADPRRGDVIVCFSPANGLRLVKRVIGVPGDVIALRDEVLFINGVPARYVKTDMAALQSASANDGQVHQWSIETLPFSGVEHPVMLTPALASRKSFQPIKVPAGKYFVMGDNRDDSFDSRYFGFVDRSQIIGRTRLVLISLGDDCIPRAGRILRGIDR